MKTFTINSLIKFYRKDKGIRRGINSFLALFILIFFSTNGYSQSFTLQSNENYFSPSIFNNDKPRFRVTSEGTISDKPGVRYSISESSPNALAADIDQIRNGGVSDVGTGSGTSWVNGNAGASNAHYAEGWSIAYRMKITELTPGPHILVIEWDTRNGSKSAIDFITHYQNLDDPIGSHQATFGHGPEAINPSFGFTGLGEPTRKEIPAPNLPTNALATFNHLRNDYPSGVDAFGKEALTMWGGTISAVSYVSQGDYTAKDASTRMSITFTSTGTTAILGWGGHIASRLDWGAGNSAGAVNGSSYHTRLISIDGGGGNQDRSLSAAAVVVPPPLCPTLTPNPLSVCADATSMVYTYTPATGVSYAWSLTDNTANAALQGAVSGVFTTTGGTVTVVPASGGFTGGGSFDLSLVMTKAGTTNVTCPYDEIGLIKPIPTVGDPADRTRCTGAASDAINFTGALTGTTFNWTNNTTSIGLAASGSGNIASFTVVNNGTSPVVATITVTPVKDGCTGTAQTFTLTVNPTPPAPAVTYNAPACDVATFSVTVGATGNPVISGASYSIVDKNGNAIANVSPASPHVATASEATNGFSFSNIPAGSGFRVSVSSLTCGSSNSSCPAPALRLRTTPEVVEAIIQPQTPTKVLAAPNPFNDRIRFSLQSAVSGKGSLELYNMLGQKVKVVYQGYIQKGVTQTFEYNVPGAQRANLIYVFRVGDERVTGKLIGIK